MAQIICLANCPHYPTTCSYACPPTCMQDNACMQSGEKYIKCNDVFINVDVLHGVICEWVLGAFGHLIKSQHYFAVFSLTTFNMN